MVKDLLEIVANTSAPSVNVAIVNIFVVSDTVSQAFG